jgi:hypothetical protein
MLEIFLILSCGGLFLGVFLAYWIITGRPKAQARELQQKFFKLGDLREKTRTQIEVAVGKPNSWSSIGGNKVSCTWNTTRYHITLRFNGDVCEGVTSEISV